MKVHQAAVLVRRFRFSVVAGCIDQNIKDPYGNTLHLHEVTFMLMAECFRHEGGGGGAIFGIAKFGAEKIWHQFLNTIAKFGATFADGAHKNKCTLQLLASGCLRLFPTGLPNGPCGVGCAGTRGMCIPKMLKKTPRKMALAHQGPRRTAVHLCCAKFRLCLAPPPPPSPGIGLVRPRTAGAPKP